MSTENLNRLAFAGPPHPMHGFPMWFEDANGLRLDLVIDGDPMAPAVGELPVPGDPLAFPGNYPDEAFYFMAEARLAVGGAGVEGRARVIMALEAAFGGSGVPDDRARIVFGRIRVRMDDLRPDTQYKIVHPYGVIDSPDYKTDDNGRFFHTFDWGIFENDPAGVLRTGQVAPFLQWDAGAPAGYIGDGVTDHQIIGSPFGANFVMIEGPDIRAGGGNADPTDPANPDKVWTDLFSVQGRIAQNMGVAPCRIVAAPAGVNTRLSAQAWSAPGESVELVGDTFRVALSGNGRDYAGTADVAGPIANLALINVSDSPPTRVPVAATDAVYVEQASYDPVTQTLSVSARSTNPAAVLTVEATGGVIGASPTVFAGIGSCPASLDVTSTLGGRGAQAVELIGAASPALGVAAGVGTPLKTRAGEETLLDGSGSRLATGFQWTQTAGAAVILSGANIPLAKFTPAVAGNLQFELTVQGPGGPASALVDVTVDPPLPPDVIVVEQAEYRTSKRQYRVGGTINNVSHVVVVAFNGTELGRATPDAVDGWSVRFEVAEDQPMLVPGPGATLSITTATGAQNPIITIRN